MTIFCTFLDMVDVRGDREHAWVQVKMTNKDGPYDNFGRVSWTDGVSHLKVLFALPSSAYCIQQKTSERGNQWQSGSDRQNRTPVRG